MAGKKYVVIANPSNGNLVANEICVWTARTIAHYFSEMELDVLLIVDDLWGMWEAVLAQQVDSKGREGRVGISVNF
jgi:vacuolar-type H+-ATPase catalytic subunit A/Vma1